MLWRRSPCRRLTASSSTTRRALTLPSITATIITNTTSLAMASVALSSERRSYTSVSRRLLYSPSCGPPCPPISPVPPVAPALSTSVEHAMSGGNDSSVETEADLWHDIMFFHLPPTDTQKERKSTDSSSSKTAAMETDVIKEKKGDEREVESASLGIADAMAIAAAGQNAAQAEPQSPQFPHHIAKAREAEQEEEKEGGASHGAASPSGAGVGEAATEDPNDDNTFESLEDLDAYLQAFHGAADAMNDARDGAACASEEGGRWRGQHPRWPVMTSSVHLLHDAAAVPPAAAALTDATDETARPVDWIAKEEEEEEEDEASALAAERAAALKLWQRYEPSEEELLRAAEAAEEGEDEREDDEEALAEHFWWQQRRRATATAVGEEVLPPLRIPDRDGHVAAAPAAEGPSQPPTSNTSRQEDEKKKDASLSSSSIVPVEERMLDRNSYLAQQDRLYLGPQTAPAAQAPSPASTGGKRASVLVVFAANDLRVHDNYALALASVRAHAAGGLPVVAVCVLDYRTFAQPSVVGGFFRQSPLRAQFLLDTVAALRVKLEEECRVPLLVRVGRPEEHVPRLAVELGAVDVFLTTQYAPHERRVHDRTLRAIRQGTWVSREELRGDELATVGAEKDEDANAQEEEQTEGEEEDTLLLVRVVEHSRSKGDLSHPYGTFFSSQTQSEALAGAAVPHSVWQTTLVHLDDLPIPVAAMKEGERWYHDDVTTATIRSTKPYDRQIARLADLPCWAELLAPATSASYSPPSQDGKDEIAVTASAVLRGQIPALFDLGYATEGRNSDLARLLVTEEVIATQSSHPAAGEAAAIAHVEAWLADGGMTSLMRYGRPRRTNTKLYSQQLARVSPYLSTGALSPRKFYELCRHFAHENLRDGFVQMQYREALLRLSRRDYWHWMGLRYGDCLFYSYGPHPDTTDGIPDWRRDAKILQKWCVGLTGIPFADAAMRELLTTGFVASEGRQALVWLLSRGYGQDWRLGAEWLERCSLDYDPFVCYGNAAYCSELIRDDFGETVRSVHYLAHHHDQTGIYIKKWLPQLSKVPPVYIHRPHVLTPRMQAMHGVFLGRNYPYPLKLWDGAQLSLAAAKQQLPAYFAGNGLTSPNSCKTHDHYTNHAYDDKNGKRGAALGPGYAEAARCGTALLQPEELNTAVHARYVVQRQWAKAFLPEEVVQALGAGGDWTAEEANGQGEEEIMVPVRSTRSSSSPSAASAPQARRHTPASAAEV